jgi:hypothetical protein
LYLNDETTGGIGDDTDVGVIRFTGDEKDGGTKETYAEIRGVAHDPGQGSSNKGNLSFFVQAAGDLNETLTLDEKNVGIGVASPSTLLHAKGGSASAFIRVDNSADGHDTGFEIYQNGSRKWEIASDDSQSDALQIRPGGNSYYELGATGSLKVGMGNVADPEVVIDSASGGDPKLVFDTGAANRDSIIRFDDQGTQSGGIKYSHNGDFMAFSTGSNNFTEDFRAADGGEFMIGVTSTVDGEFVNISKNGTTKVLISCLEDSSARDAIISLQTRNGGSQCRINFADGAGAGTGAGQIFYNHDGNSLTFITNSTENAVLDSSGNFTIQGSYSPSDGRLKKNVEDFSYDIEKFKAYSPKTFDWINPEEHGGKTQQIGFIAQEQEAIDPRFIEEVETDADRKDTKLLDTVTKLDGDVKGISKTSEFRQKDAMYISIIQQLITRLETAEQKIAALEGGN